MWILLFYDFFFLLLNIERRGKVKDVSQYCWKTYVYATSPPQEIHLKFIFISRLTLTARRNSCRVRIVGVTQNADLVPEDVSYMVNLWLLANLTRLCLQCEEERFCKYDTAGGPHIIQKHHLLHHTSCLCRSGKPQSSTPQQVWICVAILLALHEILLINIRCCNQFYRSLSVSDL